MASDPASAQDTQTHSAREAPPPPTDPPPKSASAAPSEHESDDEGEPRPLHVIARAFKELNASLQASKGSSSDGGASGAPPQLDLQLLVTACESLNVLFTLLGVAFAFAGRDYTDKVQGLRVACAEFSTAEAVVAADEKTARVKVRNSHARNLLRVSRGLDLNKRLFQYLLQDKQHSLPLRSVAGRAYEEVFLKHHSWAIRSLVSAGLLALPSVLQFLGYLQEDQISCQRPAKEFIDNVEPVIKHIESIFIEGGYGLDW